MLPFTTGMAYFEWIFGFGNSVLAVFMSGKMDSRLLVSNYSSASAEISTIMDEMGAGVHRIGSIDGQEFEKQHFYVLSYKSLLSPSK